jgi:serine protease AprX
MATEAAQRELSRVSRRYKVRFPDAASFAAASSLENLDLPVAVSSAKRLFFTLSVPAAYASVTALEQALERRLEFFADNYGAEFAEDYRWDLDLPPASFTDHDGGGGPSLDDVLTSINAREAWVAAGNRGGGASIAVVDTGISGRRPELAARHAGSWQGGNARPWSDPVGHGTMCAVIAAGSRAAGGRFDGVAPEARLIACRTRFFDSELAAIYDHLASLVARDPELRLIATNSFGRRWGSPEPPAGSDFPAALADALAAGVAVLFSAGNNHQLAGGLPELCQPCTIYNYKLRGDVFTVGACDLEGELWDYSSRGPVSGAGPPKPDLVAPVPSRGLVAFGDENRRFPFGWGTSGACPQAAGLAALLWTAAPDLSPAELFAQMRQGARDLGRASSCQGAGQLDCRAALK